MAGGGMKDVDKVVRQLRRQGYTVTRGRRSGHWQVRDKDGRLVAVTSGTPSDPRSLANFRAQMKRAAA
jgi:predicted RNA binding protein YcfA (HicA-like mRNA interferase family)